MSRNIEILYDDDDETMLVLLAVLARGGSVTLSEADLVHAAGCNLEVVDRGDAYGGNALTYSARRG